jgi:hypothetical protein
MSIHFTCRCGKRLRAREDMASRRSMCPNCGQPVGIPSLQARRPGLAGPLTREEIARRAQEEGPRPYDEAALAKVGPAAVRLRRRRSSGNLAAGSDWRPLDAPLVCPPGTDPKVAVPRRTRRRRRWERESRWYHCLLYPFRAWPLVIGLGLMLTALTAGASMLLPNLAEVGVHLGENWPPLFLVLIPIIILGYAAGFLDVILDSAAAGQYGEVRWPGRDFRLVAFAAFKWVLCFLAGPVVLAVAAFAFWLYGDEPGFFDRVILGELLVLSCGGWLLAVASVSDAGSFSAAQPSDVVALVLRLGWRAVVPLAVAPLLLLIHARLALAGLEDLHRDSPSGALILAGAWISLLFWGAFLFRLLGVWCHATRPAVPPEDPTEVDITTSAEPAHSNP